LWCVFVCRVRWARPSVVRLLRPRLPNSTPAAAALRNHQPQTARPCRARQVAAPCRSGVPLARPFVRPFKLLRCCSYFCSCRGSKLLPAGSGKTADSHNTKNASFCTPPRLCAPRLCAHLPLVYRSVRTLRCCAVYCVEARPSHRRSIACAALRSLAGASARRAQNIRRRSKCTARAARRSAGLHSHARTLKPDGGRSGGVSRPQAATATRRARGQPAVHQ
jgi:hypothetical protein